MSELAVNLAEIARIFGVSDRTVQRWSADGFPRHGDGRGATYPVVECVSWVRSRDRQQWEAELATGPVPDLDEARARKELALAKLREYELAVKEGSVVTLDFMEGEVASILHGLRAALLAVPGKYAWSMVGLRTVGEGQLRLEAIVAETMQAMLDGAGEDEGEALGAGEAA